MYPCCDERGLEISVTSSRSRTPSQQRACFPASLTRRDRFSLMPFRSSLWVKRLLFNWSSLLSLHHAWYAREKSVHRIQQSGSVRSISQHSSKNGFNGSSASRHSAPAASTSGGSPSPPSFIQRIAPRTA